MSDYEKNVSELMAINNELDQMPKKKTLWKIILNDDAEVDEDIIKILRVQANKNLQLLEEREKYLLQAKQINEQEKKIIEELALEKKYQAKGQFHPLRRSNTMGGKRKTNKKKNNKKTNKRRKY